MSCWFQSNVVHYYIIPLRCILVKLFGTLQYTPSVHEKYNPTFKKSHNRMWQTNTTNLSAKLELHFLQDKGSKQMANGCNRT
jgi:hypothetical protein